MSTTVAPTLTAVFAKLRALVAYIVPSTVEVIRVPNNRVPTPKGDYVSLQILFQNRLATNVTTYDDPAPTPGGERIAQQSTRLDVQADFYGALAAEWAVMFSTLFRSEFGCDALAPECQPLHADEARQIPNVTGEEQLLERHCVTATLQWNPTTSTPEQFADTLAADLINVDATYPP